MTKVKNTSNYWLIIPWFPAFAPWEVREVTREEADYLLRNQDIAEEKEKKITGKDERTAKNGQDE